MDLNSSVPTRRSELLCWPWCLLVPAFVVLWYLTNGYLYGYTDHGIIVPLADQAAGSTALEGDYLLDTTHPTLVWYLYIPFVWVLGHEWGYAFMHLLCLTGLGYSIFSLSAAVVGRERYLAVGAFALALAIPLDSTFGAIRSFDNNLLPRVVSLAPLIWALSFAIRRRFFAGFLVTGLVFNLHPTTSAHAVVIIGALWLASKPFALKRLAEPASFWLAAAPMLAITILAGAGSQVRTPYPQEWIDITEISWPYHHFVDSFHYMQWFLGSIPWLVWLAARPGHRNRAVDVAMVTIPLFCVLGYVFLFWVRLPQAVSLHVTESTRFAHYIAKIIAGAWFVKACGEKSLLRAAPGVAVGLGLLTLLVHWSSDYDFTIDIPSKVFLAVLAVASVWQWAANRWCPQESPDLPMKSLYLRVLPITVLAVLLGVLWKRNVEPMPFAISLEESLVEEMKMETEFVRMRYFDDATDRERAGVPVMLWARKALPKDALVAIPPAMMHPMKSFRLLAKRRVFVCWKDGSEVAFSESFAAEWKRRIIAISEPRFMEAFPPGKIPWWVWRNRVGDVMVSYENLSKERVVALHTDFQVTHVVRPTTSARLDLPLLYEDAGFRVYGFFDDPVVTE